MDLDLQRYETHHRTNAFTKAKGLLFTTSNEQRADIFYFKKPQRVEFHMYFMLYDIDAVFLNKNKEVVEIRAPFKRNTRYKTKAKNIAYVVELPQGTVQANNLNIGDTIRFDDKNH